jgi:hypothetical protein
MITTIINGMILTLLIGAIGYTYLMDLRIRKLLVALKELEPMVGQFSKAVKQSETSLEKFKQASTLNPTEEAADPVYNKKQLSFETNRKPRQTQVGQISLSGKSELVKSFFETAENL